MFISGYIPSPPDYRDFIYGQLIESRVNLPYTFTLENDFPYPVRDQGSFGTCVAFAAVASVKDWQEAKNYPSRNPQLSPLYVYSECKRLDGIPDQEGTYPRVAMQILQKQGVCKEKTMQYSLMTKPVPSVSQVARDEAKQFQIETYARIQTMQEIKQAIFRDGPVLAAILVCENFMTPAPGGYISMPQGIMLGGHAVAVVGWNDQLCYGGRKGFWRVRNSWGTNWGDNGYCWIPYDYFNLKLDGYLPVWQESWSSVDVILPPKDASKIEFWIGRKVALVDGEEVMLDQPPFIDGNSNRTLVPLRFISEIMGFKVEWNSASKKITLTK